MGVPPSAGLGGAVPARDMSEEGRGAEAGSSLCTSSVLLFDQAIVELTDEISNIFHEGRASLEALLRVRCARIVDEQMETFKEEAMKREHEASVRREERNEAMRRVLDIKEQQHRESLEATGQQHKESLEAAAKQHKETLSSVVARHKENLESAISKCKQERVRRADVLAEVVGRGQTRRDLDAAHLLLVHWRKASLQQRRSRPPSSLSSDQRIDSPKSVGDERQARTGIVVHVTAETDPSRNAVSHPQGPPPSYPPRDRPVLRSVRSDGSVTPARPAGLPQEAISAAVAPPAAQQQQQQQQLQVAASPSPSLVCRVEGPRQPAMLGESHGTHQRSAGKLQQASAEAVMGWSASARAPSTGPPGAYAREQSPSAGVRSLASPGVPYGPPHLQSFRPVNTTGSIAQPPQQAAYSGAATTTWLSTPRSSPPCRAVQMMTAPGSGAWQSGGSGGSAVINATPRGVNGHAETVQPGSGSFVAPAPPPNYVGGTPQRAASGPAAPQQVQQQPQLQLQPSGGSAVVPASPSAGAAGQLALLRQGSPLGRSRNAEYTQQATAQALAAGAAYARPIVGWA